MIADGGEIIIEKKPIYFGKTLVVILIVVSIFVMAVGIGIGVAIFSPRRTEQPVIINPDPNLGPSETPNPVSKMATDSALLKLKSDVDGFASELDRIDLSEPQLAPPNIDLNITIDQ